MIYFFYNFSYFVIIFNFLAFDGRYKLEEECIEIAYMMLSEVLRNTGRYFLGNKIIFEKIKKYYLPPLISNITKPPKVRLKV